MDQDQGTTGESVSDSPRSPAEIEADIERTRGELGDTVEALAAKTDVKARAQDRVEDVKSDLHAKADQLKQKAPDSAQQGGRQALEVVRSNPAPILGGAALLAAFLLGRRSARP